MELLKQMIYADSEFAHAAAMYRQGRTPILINGVCDAVRPLFCCAFSDKTNEKPLIIMPDEKSAYKLKKQLEAFGNKVLFFPARDFVFDDMIAVSKDFEQERLSVMNSIICDGDYYVIAVPDALMQYTIPPEQFADFSLTLNISMKYTPEALVKALLDAGYTKCETVEGKGQFSRRGGIIDVFSPSADYPCRIDYFGDEPDSMGIFDTITQRRIENSFSYTCIPVSEIVYSQETLKKVGNEIRSLIDDVNDAKTIGELNRDLDKVKNGAFPNASDRYFALLYDKKATLFDYLGTKLTIIFESRKVIERARAFSWQTNQAVESLVNSGRTSFACADICMFEDQFIHQLKKNTVVLDYFMESSRLDFTARFAVTTKSVGGLTGGGQMIADEMCDWLEAGRKILYVALGEREAENLRDILREREIPCRISNDTIEEDTVNISVLQNDAEISGFELQKSNFVLLTAVGETIRSTLDIRKAKTKKFKKSEKIASYSDLSIGDYVVHVNHGIGVYDGIQQLTVEGATKDFIKVNYAGGDVLYVPCGQLDLVSKYIGSESNVRVSKMGTSEWARTKAKAKAAAKDIAKDLIKLYAERQAAPGYAFLPDGEMQEEFEAMFEYTETDGQLTAAEEIKHDMESSAPMDRLLCGDVGFGKTEVALRAVFKCVNDGKQAAILVPTTILAMQHYRTILSRFRSFPVEVEMLSRFRSKKEMEDTKMRLESGKVDVIVGTHKLLYGVKFNDLGLLVIDEEQRFGVKHKEKLKELAANVDVLTLSATPIPRTLNMALTGIRDMSVLEEAPHDRAPVQSYVFEYDEQIIDDAIRRELRRGGQVFYLHNNVDSIYGKAGDLERRFPDAAIAVGHGQMSKEELSAIWQSMVNGEVDILVCTTIIETGVDVPNANTLIIEGADRMGLSQLHQIRGRVGRSPRKAYAYFTYRKETVLSETAVKRLAAIKEFTEFGSGFKIAMRDLEIRGAGNLLGAEQSGQMESIGYDLYVKLLEEAVNEEKGIKPSVKKDCLLDINCDAYIPESYVISPKTRIDFYRKIALLESVDDKDDLCDEMIDRFGDIPKSVENLMDISLCRNLASSCNISKISQNGMIISFFVAESDKDVWMPLLYSEKLKGRMLNSPKTKPCFCYRLKANEDVISKMRTVLEEYAPLFTKSR